MTITNERLAELERLLPNLKAWPNQYVQPQDVLELIRLARLAAVRGEALDRVIKLATPKGNWGGATLTAIRIIARDAATDAAERGEA